MKRKGLEKAALSNLAKLAGKCRGCVLTVTKPIRPDVKGIIESHFKRINQGLPPLRFIAGKEPQKQFTIGK